MTFDATRRTTLISLLAAMALAACGGGGTEAPTPGSGGLASAPAPAPEPGPAPAPAPAPAALSWRAGGAINTTSAREVYAPALDVARDGSAVMAWVQREGLSPEVRRLYAAIGSTSDGRWGTPVQLNEAGANEPGYVRNVGGWNQSPNNIAVVTQRASGDAYVIWMTTTPEHMSGPLLMRRYSAGSKAWGATTVLSSQSVSALRTAASENGHIALAWLEGSALAMRVMTIKPGGEARYLDAGAAQLGRIAIDNKGKVSAAWSAYGRQWLTQSGTPSWSQPIEAGITDVSLEWFYDLAAAPDGEVMLAWTTRERSVATLRLQDDGAYQFAPALRAESSSGMPSLAYAKGQWSMAFVAASVGPESFASASVLQKTPYASLLQGGQA